MSEHDDWAEINRLEAENARLRAELAAEREAHKETLRLRYCAEDDLAILKEQYDALLGNSKAERDALRAQLDEAGEALEPFAAIADIYEIDALSVGDLETFIDVVELRRARAVLDKIKGGGDE